MSKNLTDELKKVLGQNSLENVKILEDGIDIGFQMEYVEYITHYADAIEKLSEEDCYNILINPSEYNNGEISNDDRKYALANIARRNTVKAFRTIEQFEKIANPDWNLSQWIKIAMRECKSNLEFDLTGIRQVFVSTGLGSKDGKIRYFAIIWALPDVTLTQTHKHLILSELKYNAEKFNSEIEHYELADNYISLVILIPFEVEIRPIFINSITECNNLGHFLNEDYFVTNVKTYNPEEIEKIVKKAQGKYPGNILRDNLEND